MNGPATGPLFLLDLLRHGLPEGGERYRGSLDDVLSETGWQQMRQSVPDATPYHRIVTSPLKRCADFAQSLGESATSKVPVITEPRLREISFGRWEGFSAKEIIAQGHEMEQRLYAFWRDPLNTSPPEGEALKAFQQRVAAAFDDLLTTEIPPDGQEHTPNSILVVVHGGVIRLILSHLLGFPLENLSRITVPFASLTRIEVDQGVTPPVARLVSHGIPHDSTDLADRSGVGQ